MFIGIAVYGIKNGISTRLSGGVGHVTELQLGPGGSATGVSTSGSEHQGMTPSA
jgi:hypothetical protein